MANGKRLTSLGGWKGSALKEESPEALAGDRIRPAWLAFMRFCERLQHGEIERLKIQDGFPVLAEVTKKKVKFTP